MENARLLLEDLNERDSGNDNPAGDLHRLSTLDYVSDPAGSDAEIEANWASLDRAIRKLGLLLLAFAAGIVVGLVLGPLAFMVMR